MIQSTPSIILIKIRETILAISSASTSLADPSPRHICQSRQEETVVLTQDPVLEEDHIFDRLIHTLKMLYNNNNEFSVFKLSKIDRPLHLADLRALALP
jgi:hypothetical protein